MRLINMTDFVLSQTELLYDKNQSKLIHNIVNYAQFLKQPLKLEMFVPLDEDGNVLEYPIKDGVIESHELLKEYEQAKERVLFEDVKIKEHGRVVALSKNNEEITVANTKIGVMPRMTVENLVIHGLKLTQNAIKQLGL